MRDPTRRRRRLFQRGAAGALSLLRARLPGRLRRPTSRRERRKAQEEKAIPKGEIASSLYFANWPLYIDEKHSALKRFQDKYGTKVKYVEEINDNDQFFGKVRQQYAQGDSGGRDIHVVTDWMAARMIRLGYVQKFDKAAMPNAIANIDRPAEDAAVRPQARVLDALAVGHDGDHLPQGQGKRPPKSVDDLFDPRYKGKVTFLTEMRDSVGARACAWQGADPEKATLDEYMKAIDKLQEASDSGQIRGFTGNEYMKDIPRATRG